MEYKEIRTGLRVWLLILLGFDFCLFLRWIWMEKNFFSLSLCFMLSPKLKGRRKNGQNMNLLSSQRVHTPFWSRGLYLYTRNDVDRTSCASLIPLKKPAPVPCRHLLSFFWYLHQPNLSSYASDLLAWLLIAILVGRISLHNVLSLSSTYFCLVSCDKTCKMR